MVEHQLRSVVVLRTFGEPNRFHEGSSGVVGEVNVPRRVGSICSAFTEADDSLAPRARHHTGVTALSGPSWNEGFSAKARAKAIDLPAASLDEAIKTMALCEAILDGTDEADGS